MDNRIFDRTTRLLGTDGLARLQRARVIIFGVGGVGSWAAEALARTGVGHLTLVDADTVAATNINRQLEDTTQTIGMPKVEALASRLREINPGISLQLLQTRFSADNAQAFGLDAYDFVIDAIDSLADKATLLLEASALKNTGIASSMGAALRIDPTKIKVAEFWKVTGCPLGAALRSRFRRAKTFPARKIQCVYSDERPLPNLGEIPDPDGSMNYGKAAVNGSLCHITSIFGMTLAGLALSHITGIR
ncbi:MAG: tRNA threonylcarbamoyladenosine dehydratase [Muribaculaceae bacterium]|nr:tRNA threonylcarbamoyladenosine dehydratase [Muribaculaceae bacterium]